MEYNTQRPKMEIPEYGRNVQQLVDFVVKIEDRDERNKVAQAIIRIMGQLNPHLRDAEEYKHKLWAHLFVMSRFELDVDSPYPIPTREILAEKPDIMPYPRNKIRYGHYGNTTQLLINKAIEFPEGDEKDALIRVIANVMKKDFVAFNNRGSVENEVIQHQMDIMSDNKLKIKEPDLLMTVNEIYKVLGPVQVPQTNRGKHSKYKKKSTNKSNYKSNNKRNIRK